MLAAVRRIAQQNTAASLQAEIPGLNLILSFGRFFRLTLADRLCLPQHRDRLRLHRRFLLDPTHRVQPFTVGLQEGILALFSVFNQLLEPFKLNF